MGLRRTWVLAVAAAIALVVTQWPPAWVQADIPVLTNTTAYTGTGTQNGPKLSMTGQNTCVVTTSGGATGYTVTVKGSSIGSATLSTLTQFGSSGAITTDSANVGSLTVTPFALTTFSYVVTGTITGTLTVVETCSPAASAAAVSIATTLPVNINTVTAVAVPATPSAAPAATALPVQSFSHAQSSNGWLPFITCDKQKLISVSSSGYAELVAAGTAGQVTYVCGVSVQAAGVVNVKFSTGTKVSTACDTTAADLTGAYPEIANSGFTLPNGPMPWFKSAAASEICINLSASIGVFGVMTYATM